MLNTLRPVQDDCNQGRTRRNRDDSPGTAWQISKGRHRLRNAPPVEPHVTASFVVASVSHIRQILTMLRLKPAHRAVLADKLPDAANVVLAGFVVGQALS